MANLTDYSGEFKPDLKYEDLSKDALSRLLTQYAWMNMCLDGWWHSIIKENRGKQEAADFEKVVWQQGIPYRQMRIMKALNIQGNDVATCIKTLQMDPWFCFNIFDLYWELNDPNHGLFTVRDCPAVRHYEAIDDADTLGHMCQLDLDAFNRIASFFNPGMQAVALKVPPRKSKYEICCKFEFRLEPKTPNKRTKN